MGKYKFSNPSTVSHVYHYQRFKQTWIESLINEKSIRFSSPMDFNDPWDCRPCYNKSILDDPVELQKHVDEFLESDRRFNPDRSETARQALAGEWLSKPDVVRAAITKSSVDMAEAINRQYKVYCVGTKPDCQLMWAHYAASHTGICLEFSTRNDVFSCAYKVEYLKEFQPHSFLAAGEELLLPLITKSDAWSYEGEYRLIAQEASFAPNAGTLTTTDNFFRIPDDALTAIIMGARIKQDDRSWLEDFIKKSRAAINLKAATSTQDKYELAIS